MVRTQISLTEEQHRALQERAGAEGRSMSAIIRDALDGALRSPSDAPALEERWERVLRMPTFASGLHDVSERHDRHLADGGRW
ncbi:MAG: ribbon-helix-helix protein, CopG family [Acidimicrobiales bacterium]